FHPQRGARPLPAFVLGGGQEPFFLCPVRLLLFIDVAGSFASQSQGFHPPSQGVGTERARVEAAQMVREQGHGPYRRAVTKAQRIATDLPENTRGGNRRSRWRAPAPRRVQQRGDLMSRKIARDPAVDRLQTNPGNAGHFREGAPLGNQQDHLNPLKGAFIDCPLQRFLEPPLVVSIETKFG
ncbi:MAG TPA: hypothetical protein VFM05_13480, partial [Candidatus Saccharimonadales bacterium]|nr:hypothetical protein [Candidatus Saccharimonadales bacterium]